MSDLAETVDKIRRFAGLEQGWSYGEGRTYSEQTIRDAEALAVEAAALGFESMNAFPGLSGEVQITLYAELYYYELTVEPDKGVTLLQEQNQAENFYAAYPSLSEAVKQLGALAAPHLANPPYASAYATVHQSY